MNITRRGNAKAITLVEAMLAIAILILLTSAITYAMISANNLQTYIAEKALAITHAQSALDHVQDIALAKGHDFFDNAYELHVDGSCGASVPVPEYIGKYIVNGEELQEQLRGEEIRVCFPGWDPQIRYKHSYAFVRVIVAWSAVGNMPGANRLVTFERYIRFNRSGF